MRRKRQQLTESERISILENTTSGSGSLAYGLDLMTLYSMGMISPIRLLR